MIEIVAHSQAMREAIGLAEKVAVTNANVLITGESGAGKDAVALFIHTKSSRATGPFVKIDCATLPAHLLEAELFGYERGAFTGASEDKPGRLEAANNGTLVLDEIAHLSADSQAKLLRVIESREFERLGGRRTIKVDARLIALTNVDLDDAVKSERFRGDLYFRLNVVEIRVPALRDRADDLPELALSFVRSYAAKHGRSATELTTDATSLLGSYDFPGNVRELANMIERAVIVSNGHRIKADDFPESMRNAVSVERRYQDRPSLADVEADYVQQVLKLTQGNKTEAAKILGISRKNLYEKLARGKDNDGEAGED